MGNWQLEAFKMSFYVMFPVGCFWLFNQPQFFEDWMIKKRREMYPPEDPKIREVIQQTIETMQQNKQAQLEEELSKIHKSS